MDSMKPVPDCGIEGHTIGGWDGERHWCVECTAAAEASLDYKVEVTLHEWIDLQRARVSSASPGAWLMRYGGGVVTQMPGYHRRVGHFEIRLDPEDYGTDVIHTEGPYVVMAEEDGLFIEAHNPKVMAKIYDILETAITTLENIRRPVTSLDRADQAREALLKIEKLFQQIPRPR